MKTIEAFRERLEELISEYFDVPSDFYRPDGTLHEGAVEKMIWMIISNEIFTVRELQQEAMTYDVALPRQYIAECVAKWERIKEVEDEL